MDLLKYCFQYCFPISHDLLQGKRYFTCPPGHGLFVPLERLAKPTAQSPSLSVHRIPEKPVAMNRAAALRIEHGSVAGSDVTGFSMMSKTSVAPAVRQAERTNQKVWKFHYHIIIFFCRPILQSLNRSLKQLLLSCLKSKRK